METAAPAVELPPALAAQLRPAFPAMRRLLRVFHHDARESLAIDDVLVGLYLQDSTKSVVAKRSTVTQALHDALTREVIARVGRGRYAITEKGRKWLADGG